MRYCMNVPIFGEYGDVRLLATMAKEAEEAGWDGFFVWDHVHWSGEADGEPRQPSIDPWVAITAIALNTERIRIGPMVTPLARRRPWKVARETVTIDHLSNGRLNLGVGLGFPPGLEYGDFGEQTDAKVLAEKLDEGLEVLTQLWTGKPVTYDGTHYHLKNAELLPATLQQPRIPIWVAGIWPNAKAPFRRAAKWDGVWPIFDEAKVKPEQQATALREMVAYIQEQRQSDAPFEVIFGGSTEGNGSDEDAHKVGEFAAAGVTWWDEAIIPWRGSLAEMRDRIRKGPPILK